MKILLQIMCLSIMCYKLTAQENQEIQWTNYKEVAKNVPSSQNKKFDKKMYNIIQILVANMSSKRQWNKLRPLAMKKITSTIVENKSEPLVMFEWSDHITNRNYIAYNAVVLTSKSIMHVYSDSDKIVLKKVNSTKKINDYFLLNRKLLEQYDGQVSRFSTNIVLYFATVWENKKVKNSFIALNLPWCSSNNTIANLFFMLRFGI